jgi:ADP-heptose:LPS heptosyltransferase
MKISFMKFLDEYVGRLIASALMVFSRAARNNDEKNPQRILVIKFWGIGSVTLSIPLLVHLKKKYPGSAIHYLTLENNSALCKMIREIDCIHAVSTKTPLSFFATFTKTIYELRREHIDVVFDLEFFTNISAIISALSGAPERIGFVNRSRAMDVRKRLYSRQVEFCDDKHTAENFLRLADTEGTVRFSSFRFGEVPGEISLHPFSVLFNINASPLAYERRWEREEFRQLAEFLIEEFDAHLYLTGSGDEREYVQEFFKSFRRNDAVTNLCGESDVQQFVSLISRCQLMVTNDSGPLHLASALNIPTIAFFGPETPLRYGSLSDFHLTFYKDLWCSPCMTISNLKTVNCINNRQCMKQIRFSEIKEAVNKFVRSLPNAPLKMSENIVAAGGT